MTKSADPVEGRGLRLALSIGLLAISLGVGQWYFRLAMRTLFVFRADEPRVHLLALPALVYLLPGGLFAAFKPRAGGIALLAAGVISGIGAIPAMDLDGASILHYWLFFALPVCALGTGFWAVGRFVKVSSA